VPCSMASAAPSYTLRIPREDLPKELQRLPTDEVEDMLCAYREILRHGALNEHAEAAQSFGDDHLCI
jgi:hypothetical protein